jgi:hypothetical protein
MVTDWAGFVTGLCLVVGGVLLFVFVLVWLWPEQIPRGRSVGEIRARIHAEQSSDMDGTASDGAV